MRKAVFLKNIAGIFFICVIILSGCAKSGKEASHHDDDHSDEPSIHQDGKKAINLDAEAREMINLTLYKTKKTKMEKKIKSYGKIAQDTDIERYIYIISDTQGYVEKILVNVGDIVEAGAPILILYTDDGQSRQISSPAHGTVISIHVKSNDTVDTVRSLMSIIDLDRLRSSFGIYEKDLSFISVGQKVNVTSVAYPDKIFDGQVVYISPRVDEHTQSIKVRVDIDNADHLLRLGMFVSGEFIYVLDEELLAIPASAIQVLDEENVVFIPGEDNEFIAKDVVLGQWISGTVEIKEGLREGDDVVTEGSFYLKSELAKESFGDGHGH